MDVIISWSKSQSREIAAFLREWLKEAIPGVQPWMSEEDIEKGREWFPSLMDKLGETSACLICVTQENLHSPWIYFEIGAIAGKRDDVRIFPYLIGVSKSEIESTPLARFQATDANKTDTSRLVRDINRAMGGHHDEKVLDGHFKSAWPRLKRKLQSATQEGNLEDERPSIELSAEARELLLAAVKDPQGLVMISRTMHDTTVRTGGKNFAEQNAKSIAHWTGAAEELANMNLLQDRAGTGNAFFVTGAGFKVAEEIQKSGTLELLPMAKEMLLGLTEQDQDGTFLEGVLEMGEPREQAKARAAFNQLKDLGLLEYWTGEAYKVTDAGYAEADRLRASGQQATPLFDDNDILSMLETWLSSQPEPRKLQVYMFDEVDREMKIPPGSTKRLLEKAAVNQNYQVERKGPSTIKFKGPLLGPNAIPDVVNPRI